MTKQGIQCIMSVIVFAVRLNRVEWAVARGGAIRLNKGEWAGGRGAGQGGGYNVFGVL